MFRTARRKSKAPAAPRPTTDAKRDREAKRSRERSANSREIGPIPAVVNPARRASTFEELRLFCVIYFPHLFYLPFSAGHLKMIAKLQRAILHGGLFAYAMPRGEGKTTITVVAAVFAIVHGHCSFASLIGATAGHGEQLLSKIKAALRTNVLLAADFPEICFPIRALEDDGRRCKGQTVEGRKTLIIWGSRKIVLPTIEGSKASAAILTVGGITGAIRGQSHTLPDGRIVRPSLAILDDPQTKTSAWSNSQCRKRVGILQGDILMMAGPDVKIAGVMPCTAIRAGDMADEMLDRKKHPLWQGERSKMLISFPTNTKLWEQYATIQADSLNADGSGIEATDFYRLHREEMDVGAQAAWPQRFNPDEISAIQSAMNLFIRDEEAFFAECQNEPKKSAEAATLKAADIIVRVNGHARGTVPTECTKIAAFVDVQDAVLFYGVCAFTPEEFGGCVIDYGTYPEQPRKYFTLRQASPTLASIFPGMTKEACINRGLETLIPMLLDRKWMRDDGAPMSIERLLIDQGYLPAVVHNFIRVAGRGPIIVPSKGIGITAAALPMSEYRRKPGETIGTNWMIPAVATAGEIRHVRGDVNFWKSFVHGRLALPMATKGAFTLYGDKPNEHRMLADHLAASEYRVQTSGRGRDLEEWKILPSHPDNHFLDVLIGCFIAASMIGCGNAFALPPPPPRRPSYRGVISLDEQQDYPEPVSF